MHVTAGIFVLKQSTSVVEARNNYNLSRMPLLSITVPRKTVWLATVLL